MRIVRSESPSLPPLHPLLPSENSWALQVEREEAAHLHSKDDLVHREHNITCRDYVKERICGSSKWADCGSREAFHENRDAEIKANPKMSRSSDWTSYKTLDTRSTYVIESCDNSRRQARSIRKNTRRSPSRSHRSHHRQTARADLHETAMYTDTKMLGMANRSRHTSSRPSDNAHSKQSHRARYGGTQAAIFSGNTGNARHGRTQDLQLSENRDNARHGYHRRTQDVKLAEIADNARHDHAKKPSEPVDNERHDCPRRRVGRSSGHKTLRRSKGNVGDEVENESNQGVEKLKLEAISHFDNQKQRKYEGCIQAPSIQAGLCFDEYVDREFKESNQVSSLSDNKHGDYKKEGNGDCGIDARNGTCQESSAHSEIKTRFASEFYQEVGALLMHEESDSTSLQSGEGTSSTLTEGQRKGSSGSKSMLEMSSKDDVEAKEDDPLDTEKQYQMLASLLLDDSLDIDQDFDVILAPGGPDLEYCGSIFGDDFELPVDVEAAAHVKDAVSAKTEEAVCAAQPVDSQEPHLCVMRGLFQDGKNTMNCESMSSNKPVESHAVLTNTGFQPAEKRQSSQDASKTKPSPRVFVDVTNKFEIHAAPVKRETEENDTHRLNQRQRQVEFGKNTLGYERYSELVPRCKRKSQDPQTPNPKQVCSKRSWDGQIRKWRRLLHAYDLPNEDGQERAEDFSVLKSRQAHAADSMNNTRFSKSIENKGCNAAEVKTMEEDANLTIYDDWMVS